MDLGEELDHLDQENRDLRRQLEDCRFRRSQELQDLRIVVKDQKNHIKNLEDQLLPHLKAPQAEQEAML